MNRHILRDFKKQNLPPPKIDGIDKLCFILIGLGCVIALLKGVL